LYCVQCVVYVILCKVQTNVLLFLFLVFINLPLSSSNLLSLWHDIVTKCLMCSGLPTLWNENEGDYVVQKQGEIVSIFTTIDDIQRLLDYFGPNVPFNCTTSMIFYNGTQFWSTVAFLAGIFWWWWTIAHYLEMITEQFLCTRMLYNFVYQWQSSVRVKWRSTSHLSRLEAITVLRPTSNDAPLHHAHANQHAALITRHHPMRFLRTFHCEWRCHPL